MFKDRSVWAEDLVFLEVRLSKEKDAINNKEIANEYKAALLQNCTAMQKSVPFYVVDVGMMVANSIDRGTKIVVRLAMCDFSPERLKKIVVKTPGMIEDLCRTVLVASEVHKIFSFALLVLFRSNNCFAVTFKK